ncbi:MAG: hypothetical protein JOS17DRAFT_321416 [Linnemannia elongata]|nr:MAG: hypothetical protein JOS17DRAFT_321416 [Linnemannia elongata]
MYKGLHWFARIGFWWLFGCSRKCRGYEGTVKIHIATRGRTRVGWSKEKMKSERDLWPICAPLPANWSDVGLCGAHTRGTQLNTIQHNITAPLLCKNEERPILLHPQIQQNATVDRKKNANRRGEPKLTRSQTCTPPHPNTKNKMMMKKKSLALSHFVLL